MDKDLGSGLAGQATGAPDVDVNRQQVNILIVDDETKNLTVLETVLDDPDYRLVRATCADEALLALLADDFALLILDIRMPGVTGFELAHLIKGRRKTSHIPIIFLTAYYNEDQHVLEGYGTGAVDYLHKPVNAAMLRSKVAVFVELHRKQRQMEIANRALLAEVHSRCRAERQLRELNSTLEQRVIERTASLQASEGRLRAIYDGTLEWMGLLTPDGILRDANRVALEFSGSKLADVVGVPFWQAAWFRYTPNAEELIRDAIGRAAEGEQVRFEISLNTSTDEMRAFDMSFSPVCDGNSRVPHIVLAALDITARKQAEDHNKLLMNEVNHRSKNILMVVQAIARQTAASSPDDFVNRFSERVQALAASHDLLVKSQWQGVDLQDLIRAQLAHFRDLLDQRILLAGPPIRLAVSAAQMFGMVVHELSTNASKHGALSDEVGQVEINWEVVSPNGHSSFRMNWIESGGPPVVAPSNRGFGSTVTKTMVEMSLDGAVDRDYQPSGFHWKFACPISKIVESSNLPQAEDVRRNPLVEIGGNPA